MQHLTAAPSALAVLARWAYAVSIGFIAVLIIVFTVTLGHALGGGILSYGAALILAGALSILALFSLASHHQAPASQQSMNPATAIRQQDKIAA